MKIQDIHEIAFRMIRKWDKINKEKEINKIKEKEKD